MGSLAGAWEQVLRGQDSARSRSEDHMTQASYSPILPFVTSLSSEGGSCYASTIGALLTGRKSNPNVEDGNPVPCGKK